MNIILSYTSEEKSIADTLEEWIESTFLDKCTLIRSTPDDGFPIGAQWIKKNARTITVPILFLNILGPESHKNTAIMFQTGCAWSYSIPVLSIFHSGVSKKNLMLPLKNFQSLDAESPTFPKNIMTIIAKLLKLKKLPRIAFSEMSTELLHVIGDLSGKQPVRNQTAHINNDKPLNNIFSEISEELTGIFNSEDIQEMQSAAETDESSSQKRVKYVYENEPTKTSKKPMQTKSIQAARKPAGQSDDPLDSIETKIIIIISDHDRTGCGVYEITSELNMTLSEAEDNLKSLEKRKYISATQALFEEPKYYLTKKSIDYIVKHNINLNMG